MLVLGIFPVLLRGGPDGSLVGAGWSQFLCRKCVKYLLGLCCEQSCSGFKVRWVNILQNLMVPSMLGVIGHDGVLGTFRARGTLTTL